MQLCHNTGYTPALRNENVQKKQVTKKELWILKKKHWGKKHPHMTNTVLSVHAFYYR